MRRGEMDCLASSKAESSASRRRREWCNLRFFFSKREVKENIGKGGNIRSGKWGLSPLSYKKMIGELKVRICCSNPFINIA
jgi:hypothetical protein